MILAVLLFGCGGEDTFSGEAFSTIVTTEPTSTISAVVEPVETKNVPQQVSLPDEGTPEIENYTPICTENELKEIKSFFSYENFGMHVFAYDDNQSEIILNAIMTGDMKTVIGRGVETDLARAAYVTENGTVQDVWVAIGAQFPDGYFAFTYNDQWEDQERGRYLFSTPGRGVYIDTIGTMTPSATDWELCKGAEWIPESVCVLGQEIEGNTSSFMRSGISHESLILFGWNVRMGAPSVKGMPVCDIP